MDRFCRACGSPLRPGDRFCGACGAGIEPTDRTTSDPARQRFAATFAGATDAAPRTDDPARQRFRDTFAQMSEASHGAPSSLSEPTSGGAVSLAISVVTVIAAVVLAPIGLVVLFFGGIIAAAVGLSFTGSGGSARTADQQMAVAGAVVGVGEAIIGVLAMVA